MQVEVFFTLPASRRIGKGHLGHSAEVSAPVRRSDTLDKSLLPPTGAKLHWQRRWLPAFLFRVHRQLSLSIAPFSIQSRASRPSPRPQLIIRHRPFQGFVLFLRQLLDTFLLRLVFLCFSHTAKPTRTLLFIVCIFRLGNRTRFRERSLLLSSAARLRLREESRLLLFLIRFIRTRRIVGADRGWLWRARHRVIGRRAVAFRTAQVVQDVFQVARLRALKCEVGLRARRLGLPLRSLRLFLQLLDDLRLRLPDLSVLRLLRLLSAHLPLFRHVPRLAQDHVFLHGAHLISMLISR